MTLSGLQARLARLERQRRPQTGRQETALEGGLLAIQWHQDARHAVVPMRLSAEAWHAWCREKTPQDDPGSTIDTR